MVNGSRIIGPSIGGVLIAAVGEGWCFFDRCVSYLAVIASLLAMRVEARELQRRPARTCVEDCAWDSATSRASVPIRTALLLLARRER